MGLLDKIRERRQKSVLPEEVTQYYQSTGTQQKRGVAIVLAALALVATVVLASGVFFAGRFAYNKIAGDDDKATETAQQENGDFNNPNQTQEQSPAPNQGQQTPNPTPSAPAPQPAPANPATPALGDEDLPHTGDEGM